MVHHSAPLLLKFTRFFALVFQDPLSLGGEAMVLVGTEASDGAWGCDGNAFRHPAEDNWK